ncbi:DAO-domain-containing protein [Terfezia boudieri ATCC MYA-4762]|uniref:Glycerol-3-phosphate dehydrogenase n=1 Tax=Terfezia boudieri ATCC MYA-4762 TaxID=1051890 RepID=A0A3N4LXR0_9PEZI|nr:DAO-domain-containing protein [Terfezia boudieri ATCC MYA-4762]
MPAPRLLRAGANRRYLRPLLFTTAGTLTAYTFYRTFAPKPSHPQIPSTNSPLPPKLPPIPSRLEQISRLRAASPTSPTSQMYDLIIIGGGATGCGIALDAASRGLKVALIERDDFSSGTSSKSTKLVHGGVRYLEKAVKELDYNQYLLVKEALKERAVFLETAPHLSMSLPIMLPIYQWWKAPYYWAGTKAYDFLAGKENLESSYFLTRGKAMEAFPMLKEEGLVGALVYYDGSHNDSRMNVALAMTSALYGATVVNHMEVTQLLKDSFGQITGVKVQNCLPPTTTPTVTSVKKSFFSSSFPSSQSSSQDTTGFEILAKGVINATGPFTDSIRSLDSPSATPIVAPSSGVHIVLPGYYSPARMGLIDPSTSDGRVIFFLPWQGNTIAGTTDAPTTITQHPMPREEEINWILSEVRRYLAPDINVRRGDVLAAWSGIRPLVRDPNARNTEALVRNHLIDVSESGLLTIAGGKWTTYRQMAQEAVDEAIYHFNLTPSIPSPFPTTPDVSTTPTAKTEHFLDPDIPGIISIDGHCKTEQLKLIGAQGYSKTLFINLIQHFGVETSVAQHLAGAYGDRAWTVASLSSPTHHRFPTRGHLLNPLYPFIDGEVRYACRFEYAQTAVDVLARRTRLAFLNAQAALESLPKVIDIMGEELGWSGERREREWKDTVKFLESMGLPRKLSGMSRKEVEEGRAGKFDTEEEYRLYSRHDGPAEAEKPLKQ